MPASPRLRTWRTTPSADRHDTKCRCATRLASDVFHVVGGRHPVVEAFQTEKAQHFVMNDCHLGGSEPRVWILTGYAVSAGRWRRRLTMANQAVIERGRGRGGGRSRSVRLLPPPPPAPGSPAELSSCGQTQHGRQEHVFAAKCAHRGHGADRQLRPSVVSDTRARGPAVQPGRWASSSSTCSRALVRTTELTWRLCVLSRSGDPAGRGHRWARPTTWSTTGPRSW